MLNAKQTPDGKYEIAIEGEATIYTAAELKSELAGYIESCNDVSLDLSAVSEIDTACFQLLIQAKREFQARGQDWRIVAHSPAVLEVLDAVNLAGLDDPTGIALLPQEIAGNVISGNAGDGIVLAGSGTDRNILVGNLIGLDQTGKAKRRGKPRL